jgi:23S rRNA pseudouridine1911/1915/1917 synthase
MREIKLEINEKLDNLTVGQILTGHLKLSKRLITKLKQEEKGILLNGSHVTVRGVVKEGDTLTVNMPEKTSPNVVPVNIPLDILYEDEDLLVVNKPQDMPVHPSMNNYENTLGNAVMYYFRDEKFVYRAVNRLDRDTTGVVIIAKTPQASHSLSLQMQKGIFKKRYLCVTQGVPNPLKGEIDAPIRREKESVIKRIVAEDGKRAVTRYEVLEENGVNALVSVDLLTGRTHQIRVHFSYIGCPLKNDFLYGTQENDTPFMLHCGEVCFNHPVTGEQMKIMAPVPTYMKL